MFRAEDGWTDIVIHVLGLVNPVYEADFTSSMSPPTDVTFLRPSVYTSQQDLYAQVSHESRSLDSPDKPKKVPFLKGYFFLYGPFLLHGKAFPILVH